MHVSYNYNLQTDKPFAKDLEFIQKMSGKLKIYLDRTAEDRL